METIKIYLGKGKLDRNQKIWIPIKDTMIIIYGNCEKSKKKNAEGILWERYKIIKGLKCKKCKQEISGVEQEEFNGLCVKCFGD
jgi:hypothetical protein